MATPDQLALWRIQYEELHKSMEKSREQFMAWSEEVAMVERQNQTVDFRRCVDEIKQDIQRYQAIVKTFRRPRSSRARKLRIEAGMFLSY